MGVEIKLFEVGAIRARLKQMTDTQDSEYHVTEVVTSSCNAMLFGIVW
jgi:hypothetical protein